MPETNISLTAIYQASQQPTRSFATRLRGTLEAVDQEPLDHLLTRILRQLRHPTEHWPLRRLFRCLDYVVNHIPAHRQQSQYLRKCVKTTVEYFCNKNSTGASLEDESEDESATLHAALRWIGTLLLRSKSTGPYIADVDRAVPAMLSWLGSPHATVPVQLAVVRALSSQGKYFAPDIIQHDGLWTLAVQMGRVPDAMLQGGEQGSLCVRSGQLFENLVKYASKQQALLQFAQSVHFVMVVNAWKASLRHRHQQLMVSLSNVVSQCLAVSPQQVATHIMAIDPELLWRSVLAENLKNFANLVQKDVDDKGNLPSQITTHFKIALGIAVSGKANAEYGAAITRDIVNFFLVTIPRPVKPEDIESIGAPALATREMWYGEVGDHFGQLLIRYDYMYVTLAECLIQHVQLAQDDVVRKVSDRAAYAAIAMLTALTDLNKLDDEAGLRVRLQKLVMYLLHYDPAIEMFATAPSCLNNIIWLPTIQNAILGLTAHENQGHAIPKSKSAFSALKHATKHVRACEKLDQAGVLQLLLNVDHTRRLMDAPVDILSVYASFMHFLAALARTMAYIRAKLREEYPVGFLVMKFLCEGVECQARYKNDKPLKAGWNRIIHGSLLVINAFGYDKPSLQRWLSWPAPITGEVKEDWINIVHITDNRLSVLPAVLLVLLPPYGESDSDQSDEHFGDQDPSITITASKTFLLLSSVPECGNQLIKDLKAVERIAIFLAQLMESTDDTVPVIEHKDTDPWTDLKDQPSAIVDSDPPHATCFHILYRALLRNLTCRENLQPMIASDVLSSVFRPLLTFFPTDRRKARLKQMITDSLYQLRLEDMTRLFQFTVSDPNATQFHEMCAVALGYATPRPHWATVLGIQAGQEGILTRPSPFGALCRMLVYELEEQLEIIDAPYRIRDAAQTIEVLAQTRTDAWIEELYTTKAVLTERIESRALLSRTVETPDRVSFVTMDGGRHRRISADRAMLMHQSPYFQALLGGFYAESGSEPIEVHEVTFDAFTAYLNAVQITVTTSDRSQVLSNVEWPEVVELLIVSDRFGNREIQGFCEMWIVDKLLETPHTAANLEGALIVYRRCRDRETADGGILSDVWPFQNILRVTIKSIASRLTVAVDTQVFNEMVKEGSPDELEAFCYAILLLLCDDDE